MKGWPRFSVWLNLRFGLTLLWGLVAFGALYGVRNIPGQVAGWPLGYWFAAQGAVLMFIGIVALFAWVRNRGLASGSPPAYLRHVHRLFALYVGALLLFLAALAVAERMGLSRAWIGALLLLGTFFLYAVIGVKGRTSDAAEYYVAGRRIPAFYNGMATAADWMSAASFISLAGGLYLQGFSGVNQQPGGLAYVLGWTGGFCLLALWVAPQLREFNLYTLPDYFDLRFGGLWPRRLAALAALLCSFVYVVAQIYGVGLIASRVTGVQFEIGILLGLGGVLVCSFLGGMRAVTWTQVTQYVVLVLAFLIPVSWLAYKQLGNPLAPVVYGQQLGAIEAMERQLGALPAEQEVIAIYAQRAQDLEHKLADVDAALVKDRAQLKARLQALLAQRLHDESAIMATKRALRELPPDAAVARERWSRALQDYRQRAQPLAGMPPHARAYEGDPEGSASQQAAYDVSRRNFLALMFCLMVGTVGLPHLLTRFFTTPTVADARSSVAWSLFFIALLYLSAPALAVLVKFEVMGHLVGQNFDALPSWMAQWARVDPALLSFEDVNGDHILQFAELRLGADVVMLAMPEIAGLPYVVSGLVAAGGLAAALSTADSLLLTMGNALAHDLYHPGQNERISPLQRVMLSKFALLLTALVAAYVAAQKPADILNLVAASFSLAGSAFVPALVLGLVWARTSRAGAVAGMLTGLGVTVYYMLSNAPLARALLGWPGSGALWWGIQPVSAGVFGVAAGLLVTVVVSLLSRAGRATCPAD